MAVWIKISKLLGTNHRKVGKRKKLVSFNQTIIFLKELGNREVWWFEERQISFIIINNCLQSNMYPTGESNFIVVLNKNVQQIPYRGFTHT